MRQMVNLESVFAYEVHTLVLGKAIAGIDTFN